MADATRRGVLISLSGLDGAGKTTQARLLGDWLAGLGFATSVEAPEGPSAARYVLSALASNAGLDDHVDLLGPDTTHLVTAFLRYRDWAERVVTALSRPGFVVTDRCPPCHYAAARAVGAGNEPLLRQVLGLLPAPDLVLFIEVSPAAAHARLHARGGGTETLGYLVANERGYRELPEFAEFTVVNGEASVDEVHGAVRAQVMTRWPAVRAAEQP